jgi:hypothetical protein
VNQIKLMHQRLVDADGLPAVLAAGWDVFELVGTIASASAGESADLYPAFTFARGSAVSGRNAIAFAPSMPPASGDAQHDLLKPTADVYEIADALANLASALSMRLRESAELAADAADRSACENAASEAERIVWYLVKGK